MVVWAKCYWLCWQASIAVKDFKAWGEKSQIKLAEMTIFVEKKKQKKPWNKLLFVKHVKR